MSGVVALALAALAPSAAEARGGRTPAPAPVPAPAPAPVPTGPNILALNVHGSPMAGNTLVLIAGTGFQAASTVTFGGVPALGTSFDPANGYLLTIAPPGPGGYEAFVDVVVTNPDGQSSGVGGFHYGPPPAPTQVFDALTGLGTTRKGASVAILGTDFAVGAGKGVQVLFSGPSTGIGLLDAAQSSATTLVVTVPKLNRGTYTLVVTNFDGQYAVLPSALFVE
jgi:hypothetical protein